MNIAVILLLIPGLLAGESALAADGKRKPKAEAEPTTTTRADGTVVKAWAPKGNLSPEAQAEMNRAMQELQAEDDQRTEAAKPRPRQLGPAHAPAGAGTGAQKRAPRY